MVRVEQYATETLSKTWTDPSTLALVDPGTVTIGITRADGTEVVAPLTATSGAGAAARTYNLTQTTLLDALQVTWTSSVYGPRRPDTVEVVGGFMFKIAEFRAQVSGTFTDAEIVAMRTTVEQEIEQACGCAFVPRYTLETIDGSGGRSVLLRPLVRTVRSATVDGTAFSASDLTSLSFSVTGTVYSASQTWTAGSSNVVVGYEHGYQETPLGVKRAAVLLAKMWLIGQRSPIDDRAATFSATEGGTYSLVVPGRNGSTFGHPDVDAVIDRYSLVSGIGIG